MPNSISEPSKFIYSLDVPEVKNFLGEFIYLSFRPNESTSFVRIPEDLDSRGVFPYNLPRFNVLSWNNFYRDPSVNLNLDKSLIEDAVKTNKIVDEDLLNSFISSNFNLNKNISSFTPDFGNINANTGIFLNTFNSTIISELENNNFNLSPLESQDQTKQTELNELQSIIGLDKFLFPLGDLDVNSFNSIPNSHVIGFQITKVDNNGLTEIIFVENSNGDLNSYIDSKVKYGITYTYSIKTISIIELKVSDGANFKLAKFLASSKKSLNVIIEAVENIRPEPPQDFRQFWDGFEKKLYLTWSLANNKQRDVKKVQVYRRNSLREPYQLIKIFDFDNNLVKFQDQDFGQLYEQAKQVPGLVTVSNEPVLKFIDNDFNEDSKFIYALRTVDAHGLSSDFSVQIEISFDKKAKNIVKKLISKSGAPKNFPNLLFNNATPEIPQDFKISSGAKSIEVLFNPDIFTIRKPATQNNSTSNVIKVINKNNNNLGDFFVMNIINVDNKKSAKVKIDIK